MIQANKCKEFQAKCKTFVGKFFTEGCVTAKLVEFVTDNSDAETFMDYLVVTLLRKAFDTGKECDVETVGALLVVLVNDFISVENIERGFEKFFHIIDDMSLDVPSVYATMVSTIRVAIANRILPKTLDTRIPLPVLQQFQEAGFHEYDDIIAALTRFKKDARAMFEAITPDKEIDFWNVTTEDAVDMLESFIKEHEFRGKSFMHELLRIMIYASMSRTNREREIVSKILAIGTVEKEWFTRSDISFGFMRIFMMLPDASLDVPNMPNYTSKFVARALVDEILAPAFLQHAYCLHLGGDLGTKVVTKVNNWVDPAKCKNIGAKYEDIWVGSDPESGRARHCRKKTRETIYNLFQNSSMEECVTALIDEYLAPDLASVCCRVIIEAIMEKNMDELSLNLAKELLKALLAEHEIEVENIQEAFEYLGNSERLAELVKDVGPIAEQLLKKLNIDFAESGLLTETANDL